MKRPAFQFYPSDWRKDLALQSCGIVARGVWWELLCLMHEGQPYGHLAINGRPLDSAEVSSLIRVRLDIYSKAIRELESRGVFNRKHDGTIYSRRMVKDEHIRTVRALAGKQGGNPALLHHEVKQTGPEPVDLLNPPVKGVVGHLPTPSSAFAVASASSLKQPTVEEGGGLGEGVLTLLPSVPPTAPINGHAKRAAAKTVRVRETNLGTRLPDDWRIPDEWIEWTLKAYPNLDRPKVVRMSLEFRDYWIAIPGKAGRKANWLATWRNRLARVLDA